MTNLSLVHTARLPAAGANAPGERPPLLILMHGVGSNERHMDALAPSFDQRFVVLSVRSPLVLGPNSYGWFRVTFTANGPVINAEEAKAGWRQLAAFIDEAVAMYGADPARVYLGGFSQGGIMSLATLLTAPEKVAGVFSLSGRLLPEALSHAAAYERLHDKPVLIVHGEFDQTLGIHFARWAREQLVPFNLSLTYRELPMGHEVTRESLAEATRWISAQLDAGATT